MISPQITGEIILYLFLARLACTDSDAYRIWRASELLNIDDRVNTPSSMLMWRSSLFRELYCYPALAGIRHDLFLIFGFWHAYHYSYVALWDEFRATFLAKAFWLLYPTHKLMRRPKNTQSSTFFMAAISIPFLSGQTCIFYSNAEGCSLEVAAYMDSR